MTLKSYSIPQRYVFAVMGFFATLIGFMIRISVDLTMSHMVNETITTEPALYDPHSCPDLSIVMNQTEIFRPVLNHTHYGTLDWNPEEQSLVASKYRSAYIMTQFLGGMAADVGGGKKILGASLLVSSVATFLLPFTAKILGSAGAVVLRFISGMAGGTIIPALLSMMSKWVPLDERAFVASIIFPGSLIGHVAASYIAHPLILLAGWEAVYYTFGLIGFLWFVVWYITCFSTPNDHPYITESEKVYLNKTSVALIRATKYDLDPLPWKAFLRCVPFWACVIGYTGREWAFVTLTTEIPRFMKDVLGLDISNFKDLSCMPYVCMWIFALIFGFVSDILVVRGLCSIKFARKLFTSIAAIGSALCIILIAYSGCNAVLATFWMFLGMMTLGAFYSGVMINMLDMNPNYAGTMIGVVDNIAINVVILLPAFNSLVITDVLSLAMAPTLFQLIPKVFIPLTRPAACAQRVAASRAKRNDVGGVRHFTLVKIVGKSQNNALLSQWRISLWLVFCVVITSLAVFLYNVTADQMWWDDVRRNGYPTNWAGGLFPSEALIDENGDTILKPRRDAETTEEKL